MREQHIVKRRDSHGRELAATWKWKLSLLEEEIMQHTGIQTNNTYNYNLVLGRYVYIVEPVPLTMINDKDDLFIPPWISQTSSAVDQVSFSWPILRPAPVSHHATRFLH